MCRYYAADWKREGEERVKAVSFAGALNENSGGLRTALKRMFNRFAEEESGPHMRQHLEFMCF